MFRFRLSPRALGLIALAAILLPRASHADLPWAIAMRTDAEIRQFVDTLSDDAPGGDQAPAVIMHRGIGWDVLPGSRVLTRNTILKVNDADAIADLISSFYLDARGVVGEAQAFRIRNGELTRHEVQIAPGDGRVRRARLRIVVDDLQPGDILGASSQTLFDNILYFDRVPIGARGPVAEFSLRVRCEGNHSYKIKAESFDRLNIEAIRYDDQRPVEWHATASSIPAIENFRGEGPYEPGTPLALVAESEEFVPIADAFVSTLAWQRVALFLSGIREKAISSMIAAWEYAPQVTAGAQTNFEAESKIFAAVRDNLELMVGDKYDPLGSRTADEVLESRRATPMEQVMVMVTLLAASGLPGEIALVRPEAWGPLNEEMQSFVQFSHVAIRCGKNNTRWYVPYLPDAPAGKLPPEWGKSWVLAPSPGLVARAAQASNEIMNNPNIDAHAAFAAIRQRSEDEGWFILEQVGGSE
jgi:hypothetical protein